MTILASQLGLVDFVRADTISAHPWHRPNEWVLKPVGGWVNPPTDYDSTWELKPAAGYVYVATTCQIQTSADSIVTSTNAMQIHVTIQSPIPPTLVTQFVHLEEFLNRASEVSYYPISGITSGSEITKPFYRTLIPFAQKIFLWSTAGITDGQPRVDRLGNVKLRSMTCKIANHRPYVDANSSAVETAWSRYFVDVYRDPDYVA
jgi:hypothetical protein